MFKLPDKFPAIKQSAQEWADYAEYLALKENQVSLLSYINQPLLISDETTVNGVDDETDKYINKVDEISIEISRRIKISNGKYPFKLTNNGYLMEFLKEESQSTEVYKFLLLATRLDMSKHKMQNNIDGTHLFEALSAEITKEYFGFRVEAEVFGTSKSSLGGFRAKLTSLAQRMHEGGSIHENSGFSPQDDKLDIVAWKGFSDNQASQLIAFGQCKTGTSWQSSLSELDTETFCKTWFSRQPVVTPLKMFFCAQYFPLEIWFPRANTAGLVFDRFRILDYLPEDIDTSLVEKIKSWNESVNRLYQ